MAIFYCWSICIQFYSYTKLFARRYFLDIFYSLEHTANKKSLNIPRSFSSDAQTITFEQFYNLYSIKPEHWELYYNYVVYNTISSSQKYCYSTIEFKTSRDLEKYYNFKEELEAKKEIKNGQKNEKNLLKVGSMTLNNIESKQYKKRLSL